VWGCSAQPGGLVQTDFQMRSRLISLHQAGLSDVFNQLVEVVFVRLSRQQKQQGQSLEATLQNRFYEKKNIGCRAGADSREQVLAAWRRQLERLWPEVNPLGRHWHIFM